MKPIEPPENLSVWILASISSAGTLTTHSSTSSASTVYGYYINIDDAQQEQLLLALKGTRAHVFQLDFPRP